MAHTLPGTSDSPWWRADAQEMAEALAPPWLSWGIDDWAHVGVRGRLQMRCYGALMNAIQSQLVELILEPFEDAEKPRRVMVWLHDRSKLGVSAQGEADLDLRGVKVTGDLEEEQQAEDFQQAFLRGESLGAGMGKAFGRLRFERLLASEPVGTLWREIASRLQERRMQVVLVLPRALPWLADLPFELLCDEVGFVFRRCHTLLRTLQGLAVKIIQEHLAPRAGPRVLITGHTHAAREVVLENERVYLNTGTWTDLMKLPPLEDDAAVQKFADDLDDGRVPRLRRLTYAEVTAEGPSLKRWGAAE